MKFVSFILIITLSLNSLKSNPPKEGMWIPILLEQLNMKEMQTMGLKLTAEDIYSINQSSLKDAIVNFGGCTASMISPDGLLLTNHHCGYGRIQSHSSVENNYLKNGFWASGQSGELANPGLKVSFIVEIRDVTEQVLKGVDSKTSEAERTLLTETKIADLEAEAVEGTHFDASVSSFYNGNAYYLFITETYKDVRLVGAPPSSIGKFGYDLDNWIWPRHTGDFSLFRIYANADNSPAEYSEDNVPYQPKHYLPISINGVEQDDFTMVFGFPGRTNEYLTSFAVDDLMNTSDPARIKLRDYRIEVMDRYMKQSDKIRIQYASKQSRVSNSWKKWKGEIRGLKKLNALDKKQAFEKKFQQWADHSAPEYKDLLGSFEELYREYTQYGLVLDYLNESVLGVEAINQAWGYDQLYRLSTADQPDSEKIEKEVEKLKKRIIGFFKNYHQAIDREIFPKMIQSYVEDIPKGRQPDIFTELQTKYKGDYQKMADRFYSKSIFVDEVKLKTFLDKYQPKHAKKLAKDPFFNLMHETLDHFFTGIRPKFGELSTQLDSLQRIYMKAQMEMHPDQVFYANANSTMRISYGKVEPYEPKDGVKYKPVTTLKGIITKAKTGQSDWEIPEKLYELYEKQDYGQYGKDGIMNVCFIASNHTTGGNSGSPVINGKGELIGLNFDRNWEGTMSDIMYDPDQCRNISVDIRYVLFIIDKFAGADYLIKELKLVK